jgi:hypothetical protein
VTRAVHRKSSVFELIVGCPVTRYGIRFSLIPDADGDALAAEFGLPTPHPWGPPAWIGVRITEHGVVAKPYHRWTSLPRAEQRRLLERDRPADMTPLMASQTAGVVELYCWAYHEETWRAFTPRMLAPLGVPPLPTAPVPQPLADGYGASFRWTGDELTAVSLFANDRTWLTDDDVARGWIRGMSDIDRHHYETSLLGLQSIAPMPRHGWHALLSWTFERDGTHHRAASLRVPPAFAKVVCDAAPRQ